VIKTQSTAHDTVRHNKTKKDEKRAQFFLCAAAITKKVACCFEKTATMEHKTKAACIKQKQTTSMRIICAAMFGPWRC
jgi:hypothetical protein